LTWLPLGIVVHASPAVVDDFGSAAWVIPNCARISRRDAAAEAEDLRLGSAQPARRVGVSRVGFGASLARRSLGGGGAETNFSSCEKIDAFSNENRSSMYSPWAHLLVCVIQ
jgi:hypothetical protein